MREGVTMIVELRDGLTEPQRDSIAAQLSASEMVAGVQFVSKEEKLADDEFRREFGSDADEIFAENPLPDSFDVVLSDLSSDSEALERFVGECSAIDGVEYVTYPRLFLGRMHSILDTMQLILLLYGGVMLIISLILLNNTVRLAIFSRHPRKSSMRA